LYSTIFSLQSSSATNSRTRSSNLREARRAGEKITISQRQLSANAAAKMAIENVLPKRRGVLIRISDGVVSQLFFARISGSERAQSSLYITRLVARMKASWKRIC